MDLRNKKVIFLGDSITEGYGTSDYANIFHQVLKRKLGLEMAINCGMGGTRIARKKKSGYECTSHDLYFGLRAQTMPKDADVIFVFGGTNDSGHGDALMGDIDSSDDYTFNGALNNLINQLKTNFPNKPIIFLTPLRRQCEDECMNGTGFILKDYVNVIKDAAKRHNVLLIDFFNDFDINPDDPNLFPDGLHPNDKGHLLMAEFLIEEFKTL